MVDSPGFRVRMTGTLQSGRPELVMAEEFSRRVQRIVELRHCLVPAGTLPQRIELPETLSLHQGLGAGTQLAATVALGLEVLDQQSRHHRWNENQWQAALSAIADEEPETWLIRFTRRGQRSAIGLKGFLSGGFILDNGYSAMDAPIRRIAARSVPLPPAWRIVLVRPTSHLGMFGQAESQAMEELGRKANPHRDAMIQLAEAAIGNSNSEDFPALVGGLDRYMELAGELFRSLQGDLYNGAPVRQAVEVARDAGLCAVGQSSWGPTVFGLTRDELHARRVLDGIRQTCPTAFQTSIVSPAAQGARFRFLRPT